MSKRYYTREVRYEPHIKKLIAEIEPDTIDDSFLIGEVTDHMVEQIEALLQIRQIFPSLTFVRRGQSERKKFDIKVFLNNNHIFTLSCYAKQYLGRIYTDYVTEKDAEKALILDGMLGSDPEPNTLLSRYRKRDNWDQKYYKWYDSIAAMKEDIIHIIDVAISSGVNPHSFLEDMFGKIKDLLYKSTYSIAVASNNRLFIKANNQKQPCVIVNIDNESAGTNVLECTQEVYNAITEEIEKYIQASSKNDMPYAVDVYDEEIISIIDSLTNIDLQMKTPDSIIGGETMTTQSFDKNMILYEPPGTELKEEPRIWGMLLGGTGMTELKKQCFENGEIRLGWSEVDDGDVDGEIIADANASWSAKHMVADFKNSMEIGDLVVVEKTNKSIDAIGVITGDYVYDESLGKYPRSREVKWLVKNIDYNVVPFLNGRKQLSRFSLFAFDYIGLGNILDILNKYQKNPIVEAEKETKPYVFVIDEINHGNISKIFGELITLIEDTKREGMPEAASAILPYSGEPFSVLENVYLLGTMNTADRSIALMDTALRRRFSFEELMPDANVLRNIGADKVGDLDVSAMLEAINERITFLYDREHTIGHAFFTKLKNDTSIETLKTIFKKSVIPLLQEYFYEDYQKIQLVLGDNGKTDDSLKFITNEKVVIRNIFKGSAEDVIDIEKKYSINDAAFDNLESYKQII